MDNKDEKNMIGKIRNIGISAVASLAVATMLTNEAKAVPCEYECNTENTEYQNEQNLIYPYLICNGALIAFGVGAGVLARTAERERRKYNREIDEWNENLRKIRRY